VLFISPNIPIKIKRPLASCTASWGSPHNLPKHTELHEKKKKNIGGEKRFCDYPDPWVGGILIELLDLEQFIL
jgi:hypothetical protein